MPTILSTRHCELVINGHKFTAYADEDSPVEFPDIEHLEHSFGKDGTLYLSDTGMQGGEVTVKLAPSSPSAKRVLRWHAEMIRGMRLSFEGTYGDPGLSYDVTLRGGVLMKSPPSVVPNKTFECVFLFEQIIPNYDSAAFDPAPAVV